MIYYLYTLSFFFFFFLQPNVCDEKVQSCPVISSCPPFCNKHQCCWFMGLHYFRWRDSCDRCVSLRHSREQQSTITRKGKAASSERAQVATVFSSSHLSWLSSTFSSPPFPGHAVWPRAPRRGRWRLASASEGETDLLRHRGSDAVGTLNLIMCYVGYEGGLQAREGERWKGSVHEVQGGTFPMFSAEQTSGVLLP